MGSVKLVKAKIDFGSRKITQL